MSGLERDDRGGPSQSLLSGLAGGRRQQKMGTICQQIENLFGVQLVEPNYIVERGEIEMSYRESGISLDLSSSGRGTSTNATSDCVYGDASGVSPSVG